MLNGVKMHIEFIPNKPTNIFQLPRLSVISLDADKGVGIFILGSIDHDNKSILLIPADEATESKYGFAINKKEHFFKQDGISWEHLGSIKINYKY